MVIFMLLYFFSMVFLIWWVILILIWFFVVGLKWGYEVIEVNVQFFYFVVWVIFVVKIIVILLMIKVDGDELSGVCFVGFLDFSVF